MLWLVSSLLLFSPPQFSLSDVFSSLTFAFLRKLSSLTSSLTLSYSPFLQSFPSLHCGLFSFPHTSLPCKLAVSLPISYPAKCLSQATDVTTATGATVMGLTFAEARLGCREALLVHKLTHGEVICWAYQRVGQQTGKSQAYLFLLWRAMPVLSLLLILSRFPKEWCRCCTDEGLLVAPSLVPVGSGDSCCGQRHAAAEPDPLFHLCWYAAWSRISPLDEMLFPVAGSCIRSSPQRTAELPGSSLPAPGRVLFHSFRGLHPGSSLPHCELIHRKDSHDQPKCWTW